MPRPYVNVRIAYLSEWARLRYPPFSFVMLPLIGKVKDEFIPACLTPNELEALRVWTGKVDGIALLPNRVEIVKAIIWEYWWEPFRFDEYTRLFKQTDAFRQHWNKPIHRVVVTPHDIGYYREIAEEMGVEYCVYKPSWLDEYLWRIQANPRTRFVDRSYDLPVVEYKVLRRRVLYGNLTNIRLVHDQYLAEWLMNKYPLGVWRTNVQLKMPNSHYLRPKNKYDLRPIAQNRSLEVDAIALFPEEAHLIEATPRPEPKKMYKLLLYKDAFLRSPEYAHWHNRPVRLIFVMPDVNDYWLRIAKEKGIEIAIYRPDWIVEYLNTYPINKRTCPHGALAP